jgi:hypothetical protein
MAFQLYYRFIGFNHRLWRGWDRWQGCRRNAARDAGDPAGTLTAARTGVILLI